LKWILQAKDLPPHFWAEALYCANYILNSISTQTIPSMTPIERWCGRNPLNNHLHIFICVSWNHISDECKNKMDEKMHNCIMMGYSKELKSYQLFDPVK